jgi:Ca2+-binding EF-hand superfamily protein
LYYADYGARPISLGLHKPPGTPEGRTSALFQRLDQNRDAFLDAGEIQAAARLWQLDRDADELLSLAELQQAATVSGTGEFIAIPQGYELKPVGNFVVRQDLDQENAPPADGHLSFRLEKGAAAQFEQLAPESSEATTSNGDRVVIRREELQVEFLVRPPTLRVLEQVRRVLRREVASLPGEKAITDEETFPAFLREHAPLMDANADGKLTHEELETYLADLLPARLAAASGRVLFLATPTVTGLFAYLDQDHDGKLSKQDLSRLSQAFAGLDENADQKLSQLEIPAIVRIVMAQESAAPPYLQSEQRNAGPPWFYRLDRNSDGTLTPAEFPGTRELYEQLDQNHDQILTLEEALAADQKAADASPKQEN